MNIFKFNFSNENERNEIINKNKDLHLIEEHYLIGESYLIFSDEAPIIEPSEIDAIKDKIDILNEQNANLLLDNAKKEIEIINLNKNLANITLEIAKMKVGV